MASALALVAASLFALAAAVQRKGVLGLPEISLQHPASLAHLAGTGAASSAERSLGRVAVESEAGVARGVVGARRRTSSASSH
jgi:hypothetical protein